MSGAADAEAAVTYTDSGMKRAIVVAATIAGTLDILAAFIFAGRAGGSPLGVLAGIGSAVLGPNGDGGVAAAMVGLALHFLIALAMANTYLIAASRIAILNRRPLSSGIGYGLLLWIVMDRIVLPWRWPGMFPPAGRAEIATQLFSHVVLVGIPIALVAKRAARWR